MKKRFFYPLGAIFLVVAIALWGCKKDEKEQDKPQENEPAEVIVFQKETIEKNLEVLKDDGTLVFSGLTEKEKPEKGDIICSGIAEGAPLGFLYKVNQVTTTDGKTVITTEPASLEEAVENGEVKETISVSENNIEGVFDEDGNPIQYQKLKPTGLTDKKFSTGISFEVSKEIDNITFSGSIEAGVEFDFNLSIKNWELKECSLLATPSLKGELSASFDKELFDKTKEIELATIKLKPVTIMIGYVPLVMTPEIKILAKVDFSGKVSISAQIFEIGIAPPVGIAYDYEQKSWNRIGVDEDSNIKKPTFFEKVDLSLSGELQIEPRIIGKVGFYNTDTGMGVGLGVYTNLKADIPFGVSRVDGFSSEPKIELKAAIVFISKAELKIFNKNFGEWERRAKIIEWSIWERKVFPEFSEIALTTNDDGNIQASCHIKEAPLLGFNILKHGFCWVEGTNDPTIDDHKIDFGAVESSLWKNSGKIDMKAVLQNLKPGTTYTIAPYYQSWYGTIYEKKSRFTTATAPDLALNTNSLALSLNQTGQVQITAGSGKYSLHINDNQLATATLTADNKIEVIAKKIGNATITITDTQTKQTQTIAVTITAPSLALSKNDLTLEINQTQQVQITAGSGDYAVKSNQPNIATIELTNSNTLTITGKAQGTATLSVRDKQSGQTQTISVKVNAPNIPNLALNKNDLTLEINQTQQVQITAGSGDYAVKSNQPNIATIALTNSNTLTITGKAQGTATLSVRDKQSGQTQTISVKVNAPNIPNLALSKNNLTLNVNQTQQVQITTGSGDYAVKSNQPNIATIELTNNHTLTITGKAQGTATLSVRDKQSGQTQTISVSVSTPNQPQVPNGVVIENGVLKKWSCDKIPADGHVVIPDGVTAIGERAFYKCSSLKSVVIPNSVTSIGSATFYGCSSIKSVTIPNSVTHIGSNAFSNCSSLTSVNIPNGITRIERAIFSDCNSLTSINIPNSVTSIGDNAFYGCSSLQSINIPNGVTRIEVSAFNGCRALTSVNIPNSITRLEGSTFNDCRSLTSINIPNNVKSIGSHVFSGCSSLISVNIPNDVTRIENSTFSGCSSLTSITIPNSVTLIGYNAFSGCSSLTSITIPNNVTNIGSEAFQNCSSLTSLILKRENPITTMSSVFFSNNNYTGFLPSTTTIKVPAGSVDAYKTAEGWREYASQIVAE